MSRHRNGVHTQQWIRLKTPTINHFMRKYFGSWPMFRFDSFFFFSFVGFEWTLLTFNVRIYATASVSCFLRKTSCCTVHHIYVSTIKCFSFILFFRLFALYLRSMAWHLALRGVNFKYFVFFFCSIFCSRRCRCLNLQLHWNAIWIPRKTSLILLLNNFVFFCY